jgi:predicted nucleic acid-binding protein
MTTAIDTNVLIALWDIDQQLNSAVQRALDHAQARVALVVSRAIYAEFSPSGTHRKDARQIL